MGRKRTLPPDWQPLYLRLPRSVVSLLDAVVKQERARRPGRRVPRQEVAVAILEAGARAALFPVEQKR